MLYSAGTPAQQFPSCEHPKTAVMQLVRTSPQKKNTAKNFVWSKRSLVFVDYSKKKSAKLGKVNVLHLS